jgi:integrase
MAKGDGKWDGGYYRLNKDGTKTYYIYKKIRGRLYELSTGRHTTTGAMEEFRKFELDPAAYGTTGRDGGRKPFLLELELVVEYLNWCKTHEKNGQRWLNEKKRMLDWWMGVLAGKDLARVTLAKDLLVPLEGTPSRPHKIEVIKHLYKWLRAERAGERIKPSEDPTLDALLVPQGEIAQYKIAKAVKKDEFIRVRDALKQPWKDGMTVLGGTGWHVSELTRFIHLSECRIDGDVLETRHKVGGRVHRTKVGRDVLRAATRLKARGKWSEARFRKAVREAAGEVGSSFRIGSSRHTVATLALNSGRTVEQIGTFLGHQDKRTTNRYLMHGTPAKVPTVL